MYHLFILIIIYTKKIKTKKEKTPKRGGELGLKKKFFLNTTNLSTRGANKKR